MLVWRRKTQCICQNSGRLSRWNLICSFCCIKSDIKQIDSAFAMPSYLLISNLPSQRFLDVAIFFLQNFASLHELIWQNPVAIFIKTNHNITGLGMVWSGKRDVQVLESISLFFYQIFISQIISITKKAFCRAKGNLLPLLDKSPQVFGIARLSKVRTIQISKKIQCHWWNKQDFLQGMYIIYGVYPLEVILFFFQLFQRFMEYYNSYTLIIIIFTNNSN